MKSYYFSADDEFDFDRDIEQEEYILKSEHITAMEKCWRNATEKTLIEYGKTRDDYLESLNALHRENERLRDDLRLVVKQLEPVVEHLGPLRDIVRDRGYQDG